MRDPAAEGAGQQARGPVQPSLQHPLDLRPGVRLSMPPSCPGAREQARATPGHTARPRSPAAVTVSRTWRCRSRPGDGTGSPATSSASRRRAGSRPRAGRAGSAEGLHQPSDVLARTAVAHPLELVEAPQLDLELEGGAALAAGERHQQPGVAALLTGSLDLLADEVDRALAVGRQHVVGEAGEVHGGTTDLMFGAPVVDYDPGRGCRRAVDAAYRSRSNRQGPRALPVRAECSSGRAAGRGPAPPAGGRLRPTAWRDTAERPRDSAAPLARGWPRTRSGFLTGGGLGGPVAGAGTGRDRPMPHRLAANAPRQARPPPRPPGCIPSTTASACYPFFDHHAAGPDVEPDRDPEALRAAWPTPGLVLPSRRCVRSALDAICARSPGLTGPHAAACTGTRCN